MPSPVVARNGVTCHDRLARRLGNGRTAPSRENVPALLTGRVSGSALETSPGSKRGLEHWGFAVRVLQSTSSAGRGLSTWVRAKTWSAEERCAKAKLIRTHELKRRIRRRIFFS
jgi:hypothetical protein